MLYGYDEAVGVDAYGHTEAENVGATLARR